MWSYAVDLRPRYTAAIASLAALDRTSGLPSARERYARVLELAPDDLDARRAHGELLSEAGMLDEAQAELSLVVAATPGDLRARRALALVLASRQAGEALAGELAEVVRLDPDDLDAHLELAAAYTSIGNVDQAIASYEEVLRRRPRHAGALKQVADLYRARGDMAKAIATYERLRRVAPEDPRPVFLLGATYYEAGRLDSAEKIFTEGARYPGMLGDAYSNLGAIAFRRQQLKDAVWFLSRAAKRRPDKGRAVSPTTVRAGVERARARFDDASFRSGWWPRRPKRALQGRPRDSFLERRGGTPPGAKCWTDPPGPAGSSRAPLGHVTSQLSCCSGPASVFNNLFKGFNCPWGGGAPTGERRC